MEKILSFFTTLSLILTYILGLGGISTSEGYKLEKKQKLNSIVSMCASQGLCCDGKYFYTSGALAPIMTGLAKFDLDMNCVKLTVGAVPDEFKEKYGSNHIGGIDCKDGKLYASVEGKIKGEGYKYNFILVYDCETLEYTGTYYDLTSEHLTDGIPWCAVDSEKNCLYTSQYNNANEILVYNFSDMSKPETVQLTQTVNRIQGASVYNGDLYLSYDVAHSTEEQILKVNLSTGEVSLEMTRYLPNYDNEAEDICFYPLEDGTVLHTIDYDKLLNSNVMHYSITK